MNDTDPLLRAVHVALDERRAPFADADVIALLEASPERLGEVIALTESVRPLEVRSVPTPIRRFPRSRVAALGALGILVVGFGLWLASSLLRSTHGPRVIDDSTVDDPPASNDLGRVLAWRMEIVTERGEAHEVVRRVRGRLEREIVRKPVMTPSATQGWAEASLAIVMERRLPE